MKITGEYEINAVREDVWHALNDPEVLARCIPGCESLEQTEDNVFAARVRSKIGPVKAKFNCKVSLTNLQVPESYTLVGEGQGGVAGFAQGSADVRLTENGSDSTTLNYEAELKVGGKLAQVGSRLVAGATRKTADQFFDNFAQLMAPRAGAESDATDAQEESDQ